jgi:hypothetical protein
MTAIVAIPALATVTPIAAMVIAHVETATIIVEHIIAVARIPIAVIPATTEAYVVKAIAVVAVIIAVERGIWIAVIVIVTIAIAGIAKACVINATRQSDRSRSQCCQPDTKLFGNHFHLSPLISCERTALRLTESPRRSIVIARLQLSG